MRSVRADLPENNVMEFYPAERVPSKEWSAMRSIQTANLVLFLAAANESSGHLHGIVRRDLLAGLFVGQTSSD